MNAPNLPPVMQMGVWLTAHPRPRWYRLAALWRWWRAARLNGRETGWYLTWGFDCRRIHQTRKAVRAWNRERAGMLT